ncbi:MAG: hypothetical protein IPN76_23070 [Saprospiraceae bacterium]|nr:hypothetical protein [Saprospiraceae bacterium]
MNFNNITESVDDADFVAIKPGDVIHESMVDSSIINPHFILFQPCTNGVIKVELRPTI